MSISLLLSLSLNSISISTLYLAVSRFSPSLSLCWTLSPSSFFLSFFILYLVGEPIFPLFLLPCPLLPCSRSPSPPSPLLFLHVYLLSVCPVLTGNQWYPCLSVIHHFSLTQSSSLHNTHTCYYLISTETHGPGR